MAVYKDAKQVEEAVKHKIRITLRSANVSSLEKVCAELRDKSNREKIRFFGPIRMPTKTLRITTRKTPCGEGSKTWDRFQMKVHKRILDFEANTTYVKKITSINLEPDVDVEVTISESK